MTMDLDLRFQNCLHFFKFVGVTCDEVHARRHGLGEIRSNTRLMKKRSQAGFIYILKSYIAY